MKDYHGFKDLIVYQKAFKLSMEIFKISKTYPKEERYALTDQRRRSSRSIEANIAEAWPKKKYEKAFVSKFINSQSKACETIHWIDTSKACDYIDKSKQHELTELTLEVQRMIESIIQKTDKFCH